MQEANAYSPPRMPLPNVAYDRAHGITSLRVYCAAGVVCADWKNFCFDELQLADDVIMIRIPRFRHFACTKCGNRTVTIRSNWPEGKTDRAVLQPRDVVELNARRWRAWLRLLAIVSDIHF
jgi:hypothetical protein